jgi:hypothetical protein
MKWRSNTNVKVPFYFDDSITWSLTLREGEKSMEFEIRGPRIFGPKRGRLKFANIKMIKMSET